MNTAVDAVARARADEAHSKIEGHEELCAERYKNINDTLGTIKSILGWAGGSIFAVLVAMLGWLSVQEINRISDDKQMLQAQLEVLQQHHAGSTTQ